MRKLLVAVIAAAALFAVGAFAASLTVSSEDVASGGDDVTACAPFVDIDFGTPVWNAALNDGAGDWVVSSAEVTLYDDDDPAEIAAGCEDFSATVRVQSGAASVESNRAAISGGSASVSFAATPVNGIDRASVLVDGAELFANNLGGL